MKKSKVILAIALAVILLVTCLSAPTFSWFTRPYPPVPAQSGGADAAAGNVLGLTSKNVYTAYNGKNVTMTTTACTTGAEADYAAATSASGLGATNDVAVADRQYFCTTITNSSNTEQNISLYAANLHSTTTQFALGVNSPMRTYRDYSLIPPDPITTFTSYNTMRVYFQRPGHYDDGTWDYWEDGNYWLKWWNNSGSAGTPKMTAIANTNNRDYYVDIPQDAVGGYFYNKYYDENNVNTADCRTQEVNFTETYQTLSTPQTYFADNSKDNYNNVVIKKNQERWHPPYFVKYYSTISLVPGSTFSAKLNYPDCSGNLEFFSSDSDVFTVDQHSGIITAKNVSDRSAYLYTKAIGDSGDEYQVTTTVTVEDRSDGYSYTNVPIVKNLRIPVDSSATQNEHENIIKVYWYIKKNGSSLSFKIDRIYLGP